MVTFIRQQNASAILSPGNNSGGNIYYKWNTEEFLIDILICDYYYPCISTRIDPACKIDVQVHKCIKLTEVSHAGRYGALLACLILLNLR